MDKVGKVTRSKIMSRIRSRDTSAELLLRRELIGSRVRYQPKIFGRPDFGLKRLKLAIFVDGCFWHKCSRCFREPKSNKGYWVKKIQKNVERDRVISKKLRKCGWNVVRMWEHEVLADPKKCAKKIKLLISQTSID